jgi:cyclophilin family peptidyl-prolyl cis-trans isomerase
LGWRGAVVAALLLLVAVPVVVLTGGAVLSQLATPSTPTPGPTSSALPALRPIPGLPPAPPPVVVDKTKTYTVSFGTRYGPVTVVLHPLWALQTVNSFIYLAQKGWWDGQYVFKSTSGPGGTFFELGDRQSTGLGAAAYALPGETPPPGVGPTAGTLAMDYVPGEPFFESANLVIFNLADNTKSFATPVAGHKPVHNVFGEVTSGLNFLQQMKRGDQIFTVRVKVSP